MRAGGRGRGLGLLALTPVLAALSPVLAAGPSAVAVPAPTPAAAVAVSAPGPAASATVTVSDLGGPPFGQFGPGTVTVTAGDTVTWSYGGSGHHTVQANDSSFGSGDLNTARSFSHSFSSAGTFHYVCAFHAPGMAGTVVVLAAPPPTTTTTVAATTTTTVTTVPATTAPTTAPATGPGTTAPRAPSSTASSSTTPRAATTVPGATTVPDPSGSASTDVAPTETTSATSATSTTPGEGSLPVTATTGPTGSDQPTDPSSRGAAVDAGAPQARAFAAGESSSGGGIGAGPVILLAALLGLLGVVASLVLRRTRTSSTGPP